MDNLANIIILMVDIHGVSRCVTYVHVRVCAKLRIIIGHCISHFPNKLEVGIGIEDGQVVLSKVPKG